MALSNREMATTGRFLDMLADPDKFKERLSQLQQEQSQLDKAREDLGKREAIVAEKDRQASAIIEQQYLRKKEADERDRLLTEKDTDVKNRLRGVEQREVNVSSREAVAKSKEEELNNQRRAIDAKIRELDGYEKRVGDAQKAADAKKAEYENKLSALRDVVNK